MGYGLLEGSVFGGMQGAHEHPTLKGNTRGKKILRGLTGGWGQAGLGMGMSGLAPEPPGTPMTNVPAFYR